MAEQFDIGSLVSETIAERLKIYSDELPDGKAVSFREVLEELEIGSYSSTLQEAKRHGLVFKAYLPGASGPPKTLFANPKTVKAWHDAQKKLPPRKR